MVTLDQLYAWCIVPFDSMERSPTERIKCLSKLNITKYAYDWREKHLPEMATEWRLAQENGIEVMAVWMWIDERNDSIGGLSSGNEKLLAAIRDAGLQTQLWVSFHSNFFAGLEQEASVERGAAMIDYLCQRTDSLNLKIGLYNHGDWFGEPENQIELLKALPDCPLGLIHPMVTIR